MADELADVAFSTNDRAASRYMGRRSTFYCHALHTRDGRRGEAATPQPQPATPAQPQPEEQPVEATAQPQPQPEEEEEAWALAAFEKRLCGLALAQP